MSSELEYISDIKRIFEIVCGIPDITKQVSTKGKIDPIELERSGINLPEEEVNAFAGLVVNPDNADKESSSLLEIWKEWAEKRYNYIDNTQRYREVGDTPNINPNYYNWRNIQINRCNSELNNSSANILSHGLCAFELSDGCSVGCKFCGLNAKRFKGYFEYNDTNRELWRGVLNCLNSHFGDAVKTSICYWATEPSDNPDYFRFMSDFQDIIGVRPPTTTAITPRNLSFIGELNKYYEGADTFSVISILSEKMLRMIHEQYSPLELINLHMQFQHINTSELFNAGRNNSGEGMDGTIACITGFLINMCTRTVKIITPCRASGRWPNGYKEYASFTFNDVESFDEIIRHCCEKEMKTHIESNDLIKFRDDIVYTIQNNVITVGSPYVEHKLPFEISEDIASMLKEGTYSFRSICGRFVEQGVNYFNAVCILQILYDSGIIETDTI